MIPKAAQYILRCDDLCPTSSRERWRRFELLIEEFGIHPILAVVPDNRDPDLQLSAADPEFWSRMRALEQAGASIALHGYRHESKSRGRSLLALHGTTEFAGVPEEIQRQWIHAGLEILRGHGLNPRIWVAPRHGFDAQTLRALREEGIDVLSDGFARVPFKRGGMTWIPQQLWGPVEQTQGLWTICVHPDAAEDSLVDRLRAFLREHAAQFTSVGRVLTEFRPARLGPAERVLEALALWRVQGRLVRKHIQRKFQKPSAV
jgi:predicted deacetylase